MERAVFVATDVRHEFGCVGSSFHERSWVITMPESSGKSTSMTHSSCSSYNKMHEYVLGPDRIG